MKGGRRIMARAGAVGRSLFVLITLLLCLQGPAQAETISGFAGRLDRAIRQVEAARDHASPLGDPDVLFPESEEMTAPGEAMHLDHTSLHTEWKNVPSEGNARMESLERLRQRLVAVRREVASTAAATGADSPEAPRWREKLLEVLSRPEFGKEQSEEDWRIRLMQWLREKLGFLFPHSARQALGSVLGWLVYGLAGTSLLAVLIVLVRAALPLFVRDRRGTPTPAASAPTPVETQETLLALADARTRAGDLRGAVRAIFRWMLLGLHRAGRLEYDPALTNREHLARLKADAGIRVAYGRVSDQFELVWYGLQPLAPEGVAAFRTECQRVAGGFA